MCGNQRIPIRYLGKGHVDCMDKRCGKQIVARILCMGKKACKQKEKAKFFHHWRWTIAVGQGLKINEYNFFEMGVFTLHLKFRSSSYDSENDI